MRAPRLKIIFLFISIGCLITAYYTIYHKQPHRPVLTNESWCEVHTLYADQYLPPVETDWLDWSFNKTVNCPVIDLNNYPKLREKAALNCSGSTPKLSIYLTDDPQDIFQVNSGDECLEEFINHCCTDEKAVPNVIHHVLFGKREFGFFSFLSFMSAVRFMKPCVQLIHGDYIPWGKYWDFFISISPNVIHVKTSPPTEVFGQRLNYPEHRADVLRIDVVNRYGGVYADWDEVFLKSIEPLRQYECTMSELLEPEYIGCAFFMAKKNSRFINLWKNKYKDYHSTSWAYNSQKVPYLLSKEYPDLIHVEDHNFFKPGMQIIFNTNYNFSTNYGIHLAIRYYKDEINLDIIRHLNVLMGALCRHIILGNKELCN